MSGSKQGQAATCEDRATYRQKKGEMEFPMHKRLGDIKSDLTYLFIVVCLALFQIAAKCVFSLWGPFWQNKTSIFNNSALQLQ